MSDEVNPRDKREAEKMKEALDEITKKHGGPEGGGGEKSDSKKD